MADNIEALTSEVSKVRDDVFALKQQLVDIALPNGKTITDYVNESVEGVLGQSVESVDAVKKLADGLTQSTNPLSVYSRMLSKKVFEEEVKRDIRVFKYDLDDLKVKINDSLSVINGHFTGGPNILTQFNKTMNLLNESSEAAHLITGLSTKVEKNEFEVSIDRVTQKIRSTESALNTTFSTRLNRVENLQVQFNNQLTVTLDKIVHGAPEILESLVRIDEELQSGSVAGSLITEMGTKISEQEFNNKVVSLEENSKILTEGFITAKADMEETADAKLSQVEGYLTGKFNNFESKVNQQLTDLIDGAPDSMNTLQEISKALGDDANYAATTSNQITEVVNKLNTFKSEINQQIVDLVGGAPDSMNTLQEISKALGDDADYAATITNQITGVNARLNTFESKVNQQFTVLIGGAPDSMDTLQKISKSLGDDANYAATVTNQMTEISTKLNKVARDDGKLELGGSVLLAAGLNNSLEISSPTGSGSIGSQNSQAFHFYSGRPKFVFNKKIETNDSFIIGTNTYLSATECYIEGNKVATENWANTQNTNQTTEIKTWVDARTGSADMDFAAKVVQVGDTLNMSTESGGIQWSKGATAGWEIGPVLREVQGETMPFMNLKGNRAEYGALQLSTADDSAVGMLYWDKTQKNFGFMTSTGDWIIECSDNKDIKLYGKLNVDVIRSYVLEISSANTALTKGDNNTLRITTNSGYVDIGAMNPSWCHLYTNMPGFIFNRCISVVSKIQIHGTATTYLTQTEGRINNQIIATRDWAANKAGNSTQDFSVKDLFVTNVGKINNQIIATQNWAASKAGNINQEFSAKKLLFRDNYETIELEKSNNTLLITTGNGTLSIGVQQINGKCLMMTSADQFYFNKGMYVGGDIQVGNAGDTLAPKEWVKSNCAVKANGKISLGSDTMDDDWQQGFYFHTSHHPSYGIFRESGVWAEPDYPNMRIAFGTGIKIGASNTYPNGGVKFYNNGDMSSSEIMSIGKGNDNVYIKFELEVTGSIKTSGGLTVSGDITSRGRTVPTVTVSAAVPTGGKHGDIHFVV